MTTNMSDLPEYLVAEILCRVPMTSLRSVRSTCKEWNALSRNWIFGKLAESKNQFLGFMLKSTIICSVRIDLRKDGDDFFDLSIKTRRVRCEEIYKAYHCDGLLLFWIFLGNTFLVWNPYLGQKRLIQPTSDSFRSFALGYDNNRKHKILHILNFYQCKRRGRFYGFNIYEFSSDSWRVLDLTPNWKIPTDSSCVTLKGNAYFYAQEEKATKMEHFLLCFDFTSEIFGPPLSLPFDCYPRDTVILSCVKDKKLAVLYQPRTTPDIMEIWVTNKIDYNEVLWTKWMQVDANLLVDFPIKPFHGSFFIDEEKKVAVVVNQVRKNLISDRFNQTAHIIGQDGYFKSISVGEYKYPIKPDFLEYFPSLVQIE